MSVLTALKMAPWVAILLLLGIVSVQASRIHRFHEQALHCAQARVTDRASYESAQKAAKAQNDAQLARVKSEQEAINARTSQSYDADLARLRAELAKRLRAQSAAAPGGPGKPAAPDLPNAAPVADDPSRVSIPSSLYVRGAELELQLESLQRWIAEQMKVDPNK